MEVDIGAVTLAPDYFPSIIRTLQHILKLSVT